MPKVQSKRCRHARVFSLVTQNKAMVKWCQSCGGLRHPWLSGWLIPKLRKEAA
jgi:hypothetical protein